MRKHRRWVLWALAGVLLAGGSFALTRPARHELGVATVREPSSVRGVESPLLAVNDDLPASEPALAPSLAAGTREASTPSHAAIAPTPTLRSATTSASPARPVTSRPPTARPTLPF